MSYNIFHPDKYISELKHRQSLDIKEKPIIDKYFAQLRAKQKPTLEELHPYPNEQQIRSVITNELSPILRNNQQVAYVIEELSKSNDLMSFYKFGKLFLNSIKEVRGIDGGFLLQLWNKFKTNLLNEEKKEIKHIEITKAHPNLKHQLLEEKLGNIHNYQKQRQHELFNYPNISSLQKELHKKLISKQLEKGNKALEETGIKSKLNKDIINKVAPYGYTIKGYLKKKSGNKHKLTAKNVSRIPIHFNYKTKNATNTTITHPSSGSGIIGHTYLARR